MASWRVAVVVTASSLAIAASIGGVASAATPSLPAGGPLVRSAPYIGTRPSSPIGSLGAATGLPFKSTSTNWCGYAVQTAFPDGASKVFTDVKGTWVVPLVIGGADGSYSANWVGIDGYSSNTVEQLGTEQDWDASTGASYGAWFEMYPDQSWEITTIQVHPGDVMKGEVADLGSGQYRLSLTDVTTAHSFSITKTLASQYRDGAGSSAEWVVEPPSIGDSVLPFPQLTASSFTACTAVGNGVAGPIDGSGWRYDAMTLIDDYSDTLAVPSPLTGSGTAFVVSSLNSDVTPPATTSNAVATYHDTASIHLTATDEAGGSGVAATYHQLDGGSTLTGPAVTVSALGGHTLRFWSVDRAGNVEDAHSVSFVIDDTMPPVVASDAAAGYVGSATIHMTAADTAGGSGVATLSYRLDGGATTVVSASTAQVSTDATGTHALEFWASDVAGNTGARRTASFQIVDTGSRVATLLSRSASSTGVTVVRHRGIGRWTASAVLYTSGGVPAATRTVVLQKSADGISWAKALTRKTDSGGRATASLTFMGAGSSYWRWYFPGDGVYKASSTSRTRVIVR